jgi:hypothetical protein
MMQTLTYKAQLSQNRLLTYAAGIRTNTTCMQAGRARHMLISGFALNYECYAYSYACTGKALDDQALVDF